MLTAPSASPLAGPNRRAFARRIARLPAELDCAGAVRSVQMLDIGRDGASFTSARPIAPGSRCTLAFELALDGNRMTMRAEIKTVFSSYVAADTFKIGAHFTDLEAAAAEAIARFVAEP